MANGIRIYANWCQALHEMAERNPNKAKDYAFRIIDYGATGELNLDGVDAIDKDWLVTVSKGIDETNLKSDKSHGSPGRPKLEIEDDVQRLLDSGMTTGTHIAAALHVSKDSIYATEAWSKHQAAKKKVKQPYDF